MFFVIFKLWRVIFSTNISVFGHLVTISIEQPQQFLYINKYYLQYSHYWIGRYIKKWEQQKQGVISCYLNMHWPIRYNKPIRYSFVSINKKVKQEIWLYLWIPLKDLNVLNNFFISSVSSFNLKRHFLLQYRKISNKTRHT